MFPFARIWLVISTTSRRFEGHCAVAWPNLRCAILPATREIWRWQCGMYGGNGAGSANHQGSSLPDRIGKDLVSTQEETRQAYLQIGSEAMTSASTDASGERYTCRIWHRDSSPDRRAEYLRLALLHLVLIRPEHRWVGDGKGPRLSHRRLGRSHLKSEAFQPVLDFIGSYEPNI